MKDSMIDNLPIQDYSQKPRTVWHAVGETAGMRLIDETDRIDMQTHRVIDQTLGDDFESHHVSDEELILEAGRDKPGLGKKTDPVYRFAVVGLPGTVPEEKVGEMLGRVLIYNDDTREQLEEQHFITRRSNRVKVLEVSYARDPDAPPHHIVSALRQLCMRISRIDALHNQKAYETKWNNIERKVARAKAQQNLTVREEVDLRIQLEKELEPFLQPEIIMTAYVDPNNETRVASKHVLENAGFVSKGPITFEDDEGGEPEVKDLYILDWQKLHSKFIPSLSQ